MAQYHFTDHSQHEPGRGGYTPGYTFGVNNQTLELHFDSDDSNTKPPTTRQGALALLQGRLDKLKQEVRDLEVFLALAKYETHEYEHDGSNNE